MAEREISDDLKTRKRNRSINDYFKNSVSVKRNCTKNGTDSLSHEAMDMHMVDVCDVDQSDLAVTHDDSMAHDPSKY